jgi:hypothetical protein
MKSTSLTLLLLLVACGETKQQSGATGSGKGSKDGSDSGSESGSSGTGTGDEDDDTTSTGNGSQVSGAANDVLSDWCKKAAETKAVSDHVTDVFGKLCSGGAPTTVFKKTLIAAAYAGGDKVNLQNLKLSTDGPNTTGDFQVGIKLPISAKDHFTKVGPKGGDPDSVKRLAEAQGATGQAEILKTFKKGDDKYLERGWQLHSKTSKKVLIVTKTQDSNNESMQYDFGNDGKSFMYAQYIIKSIEGVSAYSLLTANVQIGDDSYLLTAAHVTIDNTPGGKLAEPQVKDAAEKVVMSQYKAAQDAK